MCSSACVDPSTPRHGTKGGRGKRVTGGGEQGLKEEEGEEADFTRESINDQGDPPNAQQAQRRSRPRFDECVASVHV